MFQRRCAECMLLRQRQIILSTRSTRNYGRTHQHQRQHHNILSTHPPTRTAPVTIPIPTTNHLWYNPRGQHHLSISSSTTLRHSHFQTTSNITGSNIAKPVSEAQRRNAQLELERMNRSTSRLLEMDTTATNNTPVSAATVNEARVALHYWSRRWYMHFHPGFGRAAKGSALSMDAVRKQWDSTKNSIDLRIDGNASVQSLSGDHGARQAERLLDWSLSNKLVPLGIFDHSDDTSYKMEDEDKEGGNLGISPNLACVNIIETYLLPTAYGGIGGGGNNSSSTGIDNNDATTTNNMFDQYNHATLTKHFPVNASYIRAVVDATRVMNKMKRLQSDFTDQKMCPDTLSIKAELNIWSKRAMILGQSQQKNVHGHNTSGGGITVAGISNPRDVLKQLELEDNGAGDNSSIYGEDIYTLQGCLDKMESILAQAEERYASTKDERIRPSVDWYNHILGAWARTDLDGALVKSKQILKGMEAYGQDLRSIETVESSDDDFSVENKIVDEGTATITTTNGNHRQCWASPDTVSYNSVLICLARDTGKSSAKEAEELLETMKEKYDQTKDVNIRPDEFTFGAVLHALAQAGMPYEAEMILESLEDAAAGSSGSSRSEEKIVPSLTIYNTVLNAWANCFQRNAPKRAESLLDRMRALSSTGKNTLIEPDAISISTVISCHARSKTRRGAERAEQMLNEAVRMYTAGNSRVKPDSIMFNCAIAGWTSISGNEDERGGASRNYIPAERAEILLKKMKDEKLDAYPVVQTFNIILDCWAKSETKGAVERALKLFQEMPDYSVTPDECTYNSVLHAMTREKDPKWVKCAEDMFREMKEKAPIGQITYHVMMDIHGKSNNRDGAKKAEELLRSMEKEKLMPGEYSYNICINAYARRGDHRKAQSLLEEMISLSDRGQSACRPTIHSFASVVNALAKSGDVDAVARAEDVVRKVEELEYVSPNSVLYNSFIDCIVKSRHKDSASQAEKVLLRMEEMNRAGNSQVCPNSYAYSMVLTCCARSFEPGAAERAERILLNMERLHAEGLSDAIANSRCYSAAVSAWARSSSPDAVERAFALIDRMEKNGRDGSVHGKPNAHCYNACIHAIAKSHQRNKGGRCREVLQRMIAAKDNGYYESAPSSITYSTIINACAFTNGNNEDQKEAFDLARTCFQTLLESKEMEPCISSIANFFLVISRHLKHGAIKDQFAEAVFLEGCKLGKIDEKVLNNFRKASPSAANKLLSESRTLPAEWNRNVKREGYKSY